MATMVIAEESQEVTSRVDMTDMRTRLSQVTVAEVLIMSQIQAEIRAVIEAKKTLVVGTIDGAISPIETTTNRSAHTTTVGQMTMIEEIIDGTTKISSTREEGIPHLGVVVVVSLTAYTRTIGVRTGRRLVAAAAEATPMGRFHQWSSDDETMSPTVNGTKNISK